MTASVPPPPGVALDAVVARRLLLAVVVHDPATGEAHLVGAEDRKPVPLPRYSTEVEDAHRAAALMQRRGWSLRVRQDAERGEWLAAFTKDDGRVYAYSKTAAMPHAVCLAALAALDGRNVVGRGGG